MVAIQNFDVIVIGAGPGGYVAAIRAAQLGLKTACIDSRGPAGGTCLNVGCIPSKALLQSSEAYSHIKNHAKELGVEVKTVTADVTGMIDRKNKIVKQLTKGIEGLLKKNKVSYFVGKGKFKNKNEIVIESRDGGQTISARYIIIATGSEPIELPIAKFDGKCIVSSTEALDFQNPPKHLVVIGGGIIGLEMGSVWLRLGSKVTVIEAMPSILATMDNAVIKEMTKILTDQGFTFQVNTKLVRTEQKNNKVIVFCEQNGKELKFECDVMLVAVGRRAYTAGLGLENIGLKTKPNGKVEVDQHFQTPINNIYAIGDVIDGAMLAHKAEEEGVACAELIAGKAGHVNYEAIPSVVYTWPEVASVGMTEQQCKEKGLDYKIGQFPFKANGRALCLGSSEGFVKMIADAKTDRLLGVHMVGPTVSELIAEIAILFEYSASAEDVARSVHAHPTLAEVIKEAALAVDKRSIHM